MVGGGKPARIAGVRQNQGLPRIELIALKKWIGPGSRRIQKLAGSQTRFSRSPQRSLIAPQVHFPKSRFHGHNTVFASESVPFSRTATIHSGGSLPACRRSTRRLQEAFPRAPF